MQGEELEQAKQALEEEKDYEVFDELPFWSNGKGVVNKRRRRLYLFDVTSGECQLLSPAYMNVSSFRYRAQDDLLLYYGHDYEWMDDQKDDMYLLHLNHPEQQPEIQQLSIQLKHRYGAVSYTHLDVYKRQGREEQATMTTLAGLIVVLMMMIEQISLLFETVKSVFGL